MLAELLALLGVGERLLEGPLGDADRLGGDADAAAVEGRHGDLEALALLAQAVAAPGSRMFSNASSVVPEALTPSLNSWVPWL